MLINGKNHIEPTKLVKKCHRKVCNLYVNENLANSYPNHPPNTLTLRAKVFKAKGKQIIDGVGNKAQLNKLPPKTAINERVIIPRNITHPSSLKGCKLNVLKSPLIE